MANLRSLDLNLLTVFEAVYEAGSIVRAAERLALSQSATSHAVARLREVCADDLFVRVGQGITPTPVAQRIYPEIKRSLEGLRHSLAEAQGFDPAVSTRHFRIAIPHPNGPVWGLALRAAAATVAPGVRLTFDTRTIPTDLFALMRSGELDLAVDWVPAEGERFVCRRLFDDAIVFIARAGHTRATPQMGSEALRAESFVRHWPRSGGRSAAVQQLHDALGALDVDWAISLSEFLEVPYLVLTTDLIGYVPRSLWRHARPMGLLQVVEIPVPPVAIPVFELWHETRRGDEGHRWLRELVAATVVASIDA
jgi:DNA-binding transcriptional LysR family regulator